MRTAQVSGGPERPPSHAEAAWAAARPLLLVALLALLYARMKGRSRRKARICPSCGCRNTGHRANCRDCSAPLYG